MNILMSAVSSSQESRFHNGTGHILDLAVSNSILDLFAMSLSKIPLTKMEAAQQATTENTAINT